MYYNIEKSSFNAVSAYLLFRGKFKLCIHTKHSFLILNLYEQQAYIVVQLSDFAKNWHFCTTIIVNISIPPPLDPKTFDIQKIFLNSLNICGYKNWIRGWCMCSMKK